MKAPKLCPRCTQPIPRSNPNWRKNKYCGRACYVAASRFTPEMVATKFWAKVNKEGPNGCWEWTGALQRDGYAHFGINSKTTSSHRYAYEQLVGPIPDGMDLLHSCDNRRCVNPAHTRPGTHVENMAECRDKERNNKKLTAEQVREIRAAFVEIKGKAPDGFNQRLADKYGVKDKTIWEVRKGVNWSHLK